MIQFESVSKSYGDQVAVSELSFTCPSGQITGLLGNNGAGKSTSIGIALGLLSGSGRIAFDGRAILEQSKWATSEVGFVLSPTSLNPRLPVRISMRAACRARGVNTKRGNELLEQFGLGDHLKKRVAELSLGLRQRLALARSLITAPSFLVLDEPTTGLDVAGSQLVWDVLRSEVGDGSTVLVSSHMLSDISTVADRLVVISDGLLVSDSTLESFLTRWSDVATTVKSSNDAVLAKALERDGFNSTNNANGILLLGDVAKRVGELACEHRVALTSLWVERTDLQSAFLRLLDADHDS